MNLKRKKELRVEAEAAARPASGDLARLQQELATQQDEYLHLAADFDNFKSPGGSHAS